MQEVAVKLRQVKFLTGRYICNCLLQKLEFFLALLKETGLRSNTSPPSTHRKVFVFSISQYTQVTESYIPPNLFTHTV